VDQTPRSVAFCAHTILDTAPLVVADARADARFSDNPLVLGAPGIRFYAGAPLVTPDGHALGSICALDQSPRSMSPAQVAVLEALARHVVRLLEHRRVGAALQQALADIRTLEGLIPMCASCHRVREDDDFWRGVDSYLTTHTDATVSHALCPDCVRRLYPELADDVLRSDR
jgi:hypothetical protein